MWVEVDKGWAWAVCTSVAVLGIITDGTLKLQGVLFVEYLELFDQGTTATSWIGFAHGVTSLVMAPVGGYLADRLNHRDMRVLLVVLYLTSAVCVALAGYMKSLSLTIGWFGLLGICLGLEDPISLSLISRYFVKLQTLAYCIACIGGPLGTIIFPLMFTGASSYCGFRGTMLVFSAVWLHALFVPVVAWPLSRRLTIAERSLGLSRAVEDDEKRRAAAPVDSEASTPELPSRHSTMANGDHGAWTEARRKAVHIEEHASKGDESPRSAMVVIQEIITPQMARMISQESRTWSVRTDEDDEAPEARRQEAQCRLSDGGRCVLGLFESHVRFFATPKVALLVLACLLGVFGYVGAFFVLPPLAKETGLSKMQTSIIFTTASVCEILSKVTSGVLVDKCHVSKSAILVTSYVLTGLVGLVVSFVGHSSAALYVFGTVVGAFGGIVIGLIVPMLNDIVQESQQGTAAAMFPLIAGLSGALGPLILSAVQKSFGSFRHALRVQSGAYLLGTAVYVLNDFTHTVRRLCQKSSNEPLKIPRI